MRNGTHILTALAILTVLYLGRTLFIPLCYALLLALVLYPAVARMERRGIPRAFAISIGILVVAVLFGAIIGLLIWQTNTFLEELPTLRERSSGLREAFMERVEGTLQDLPTDRLGTWAWIRSMLPEDLGALVIRVLELVFGMLFNVFIIPLIAALLLYDRRRYVHALMELAGPGMRPILPEVLHDSVKSFAHFISGTAKVYVIVGVLNSIGLLLLGVDNAVLFGMLSAIMTIIPYIGITISSLLPMSMVWLSTGSILYPLGVVLIYGFVQYLEANFIYPRVVGRKLHLNTLASIVIVFAGALLWGASGMILSLPFLAIINHVSTRIPSMSWIHVLLGNEVPAADPPKDQAP